MKFRTLGATDIEVSTICMGCWALIGGRTWGRQDRDDSVAAIRAAFDAGVTCFDTAPAYGDGESEALLGEALAGHRNEIVLATKISRGEVAPADLRASCERSLELLGTDRLDLLQVHWPNPKVPQEETFRAMEALKREGKVRAIGVSNYGISYLREVADAWGIQSNQVAYNLLWRGIEHEIQPFCTDREISILPYSSIAQGLLSGKFHRPDDVPAGRARTRHFSTDRPETRHGEPGAERLTFEAIDRIRTIAREAGVPMTRASLAWLLSRPGVASVIVGARNPTQARENAAAGDVELPPDVLEAMTRATDPLKDAFDSNADMWQSDSRMDRVD